MNTVDVPLVYREAEHWHEESGKVRCDLCYRDCLLGEGETGTCGFRGNESGRMELYSHGVVSSVVRQIRGYAGDPFLTYKPGQTSLFLGGVQCTAACSFCMSTQIVHKPKAVEWVYLRETTTARVGHTWYGFKALMPPEVAVKTARRLGVSSILFGINEPTLSFEWTLDVARLAKQAGLDVAMETNGFTAPAAIEVLAPYVDAVDVGTKGSCSPEFYARRMRSPGAVPHVLESLTRWRDAGVHVVVGDLVAPPEWQDEETFTRAASEFYGEVVDRLGPVTDVLVTPIMSPGPLVPGKADKPLSDPYEVRLGTAVRLAREAGLAFAHMKQAQQQTIACPGCTAPLLVFSERCDEGRYADLPRSQVEECVMAQQFCPFWSHSQRGVTPDSKCATCGTPVPIVIMSEDELRAERATVAKHWPEAIL